MARLPRVFQKLFGSEGAASGFGKFGSWADGTKVNTKDLAVIQSLDAFLDGWATAVKADNIPTLEELNSLFYLLFSQLCYLLEEGIPEWDASTTYYTGCITQVAGVIYRSLQDSNLNKDPTTQAAYWERLFDGSLYVALTGNQSVAGVKTFSSFPVTPSGAPTTNYQAANKKYVDDQIIASAAATGSLGTSFSADTVYQNNRSKKIEIIALGGGGTNGAVAGYIGATSSPATLVAAQEGSYRHGGTINFLVPPGWYWKVTDYGAGVPVVRIEAWEI